MLRNLIKREAWAIVGKLPDCNFGTDQLSLIDSDKTKVAPYLAIVATIDDRSSL